MADLLNVLMGQLSGGASESIGRQLGVDNQQAQSAITAALPILLGALAKNTSKEDGANSLFNAISKDHDGSILENLGGFLQNSSQGPGAGILKHVLGSQQGMAESMVSQSSGLNSATTSQLFTMLAPIVMGTLGKTQREQGLDAGGISSMLENTRQNVQKQAPKEMGLINKLLDADGDGDIKDDVAGIGMKILGNLFGSKK